MGTNTNIGQAASVTVFGNPESFKKLIKNHGQLCKVKQSIACPCLGTNNGSPDMECEICNGDGWTYTYQRNFLVTDENSRVCDNILLPFWNPIKSVTKVQNVTAAVQGGITDLAVLGFNDTEIILTTKTNNYETKRVTYSFDGWTYVVGETLVVDATNGIMYANGTIYDAGYQSSNPLNAYADIAQVVKVWNAVTGVEITDYTFEGNRIKTKKTVVAGQMRATYYYSDLTQVITNDIATKDNLETWTHELAAGMCKMAFYPYWDISKGDIIVISATVLWKNELLNHISDIDRLWELEVFALNDIILDETNKKYSLGTDYILEGRNIKWIGRKKPAKNATISVRYGYKPSYIIFEDNPEPNNLENKQYPKVVMAKSWSKTSKDDISKLIVT